MDEKVRVVAKIRGDGDWISVNKPNGDRPQPVLLALSNQLCLSRKEDCYRVDFCYEKNSVVFEREVKHLIPGVFEGRNATVIAFGSRGSGKTHTIQGTDEEPGLAMLAMPEMLSIAERNGNSIEISCYENVVDRVYDLLDLNRKQVFVMGDGHGKIQLKGLSKVIVTSMADFDNLYGCGSSSRKPLQKIANELPRNSHKGLIVYVSSRDEKLGKVNVGKMSFVDLAGYEDARRKSVDGMNFSECTKINKSIHALQNVIYSLSANESHVPYRESKITHILQDGLGGTSRILMVTCLNPHFCPDSVYMLSLASRSCKGSSQNLSDSTRRANSSMRPKLVASLKKQTTGRVSTTTKHKPLPRLPLSGKKAASVTSAVKARKLFDEGNRAKLVEASISDIVSKIESSFKEEDNAGLNVDKEIAPSEVEDSSSSVLEGSRSVGEMESSSLDIVTCETSAPPDKDVLIDGEDNEEVTPATKLLPMVVGITEDEETKMVSNGASPPISARLQEISNNLKLLCSTTPSCTDIQPRKDTSLIAPISSELVEPPRTPEPIAEENDAEELASYCSPWQAFSHRSSGMKNSLVQEYLKFLNTAGKEDLKKLKGIGEKRATYIVELREESPEPFKDIDDLQEIGLSAKQIKGLMKQQVGGLFN